MRRLGDGQGRHLTGTKQDGKAPILCNDCTGVRDALEKRAPCD